eukprot:353472-Chlamydomonas_euryale.AAC.2
MCECATDASWVWNAATMWSRRSCGEVDLGGGVCAGKCGVPPCGRTGPAAKWIWGEVYAQGSVECRHHVVAQVLRRKGGRHTGVDRRGHTP